MSASRLLVLLWLAAMVANLVSWLRSLSWEAQPPARFLYRPSILTDRAVRFVAAAVFLLLFLAYALKARYPVALQVVWQLPSWIMITGLPVLCCFSIWRRHTRKA